MSFRCVGGSLEPTLMRYGLEGWRIVLIKEDLEYKQLWRVVMEREMDG